MIPFIYRPPIRGKVLPPDMLAEAQQERDRTIREATPQQRLERDPCGSASVSGV